MKYSIKQKMFTKHMKLFLLLFFMVNNTALAKREISLPSQKNSALQHWHIKQQVNGFSYNTKSQMMSMKGVETKGLLSVAKRGDNLLTNFWQEGAYRSTVTFNEGMIIDGFDVDDVSRISSFRFDKQGNYLYIRTAKGPNSKTKLIYNENSIYSWPRLTNIKILSFKRESIIIALYKEKTLATEFYQYELTKNNLLSTNISLLGRMESCSVLSAKALKTGILLEAYCQVNNGSDVFFLNYKSKGITTISSGTDDEFLGYFLLNKQQKKANQGFPILSVGGSDSARQLYHGISGVLLKLLGEPMSLASDEAGKQSWSQSYRTLTLAELYLKTQHSLFAVLASQAMEATLRQQNINLNISQLHNPSCAWASRIYSQDSKTPISFLINQAMIANSLVNSCDKIRSFCSNELKKKIDENAICLVEKYEYLYDKEQGLYTIPYASNFRYDGLYAPWNWHLTWAGVMDYVALITKSEQLHARAAAIINQFIMTWEFTLEQQPRVLWRYWTPHFYQGWQAEDKVSLNRPNQKVSAFKKVRYEDLNHAGISLLGLSFAKYSLDQNQQAAISQTINSILNYGSVLPRDMDGKGPRSPRWSLGAGWHSFAANKLSKLYAHKLPNSVSNNKHYAYALLSDSNAPFFLQLSLSNCIEIEDSLSEMNKVSCAKIKTWSWHSISAFLNNNPLFTLTALDPSRRSFIYNN